ncbi:hypothetical protein [Streptomyces sp. NPDC093261]|uniref:hypothetical protein n=1 Tax=Streptomyces sp. NPDC093261 TaxID=3366037 RepID=UPI00381A6F08
MTTAPAVLDREHVERVLNEAADDVLDWADADDEGARDIVNLVINLFGARLDNPEATIEQTIEENYDEDPDEVLSWCQA